MNLRPLGQTDIRVSPIAMGCWPIAGMSSVDVNDADSLATLRAALDAGINFFDTAYNYGADGESERLIARALGGRRDEIVIATKGGLSWSSDREQVRDARPATLRRSLEESLRRLQTDRVDVLYLHAPDPQTPLVESAAELARLRDAGLTRAVGTSNLTLAQLQEFSQACRVDVHQPPYNMLQRDIEADIVPWCRANQVALAVYWPLLKGLLAGQIARDHVFAAGDGRAKYPMFQGAEWQRNHDFVDRLREIAAEAGCTVAQLVLRWTIDQPGITTALVGAKRPGQILDNAAAMQVKLTQAQRQAIERALVERGAVVTRLPV